MARIHDACHRGDIDLVKHFIENGADVNFKTGYNETPLGVACYNGHLAIVKYLTENRADVNCTTEDKLTPLLRACENGHLEIVRYLTEKGADVNCTRGYTNETLLGPNIFNSGLVIAKYMRSPINLACYNDQLEIVKCLTENGADVNCNTESNETPLGLACSKGNLEIVKYLRENGADVNLKTGYNETPLYLACFYGHLEIVKLLTENGADVNYKTRDNETPLHAACYNGHLEIVKLLTENGAYLNCKTATYEQTPLHKACSGGKLSVIRYLLEIGVDPNAKDRDGCSALYDAIKCGGVESVKLLLKSNANVNFKMGRRGSTLLHFIIKNILLDIRIRPYSGNSETRHFSGGTLPNKISILKLLLQHGAYPDAINYDGVTPLQMLENDLLDENIRTVKETLVSYLSGSLVSLAAKCIRKYEVPYRGLVPAIIAEFIELH